MFVKPKLPHLPKEYFLHLCPNKVTLMGVIEDIKAATRTLILTSESIQLAHNSLIKLINNPSSQNDILRSSEYLIKYHATFTTHCKTLVSFVDTLERQSKELAEREGSINERECKLLDREHKVAVKLKQEGEEQERDDNEHDKLLPPVINLNVGGTRFSVVKKALQNFKGSHFEQILLKESHQLTTRDELVVNRVPEYFVCVLSHFLRGAISPLPDLDAYHCQRELDFFQVQAQVLPSSLLSDLVLKIFQQWLPSRNFQLLYKATRDGFGGLDFHELCDGKGPTITLICSSDYYLFGGYTPIAWESTISRHSHPSMFLFTLANPHSPTYFLLGKSGQQRNEVLFAEWAVV